MESRTFEKSGSRSLAAVATMVLATLGTPRSARSQSDEIQIYDAGHAARGVFNLTWHNNFTPIGVDTPAFPGAIVADDSWNGVTEWALGVNDWFETGLYLPLYTVDKNHGATIDGFKLRELFTVSHAEDRTFVYGVNFEFSWNSKHWDEARFTSEIRPIVGWHLGRVDIIVNPILDTAFDGFENLDFAPGVRIAYNVSSGFAFAVEEYADLGPVRSFYAAKDQAHQIYGVVNFTTSLCEIEAGVGFGLTDASDTLTFKLLLSRDLNRSRNAGAHASTRARSIR
jgi:hypothetical protein